MNPFVSINASKIQGVLFPAEGGAGAIKVFGVDSPVIMTGTIRAADEKIGDKYVPTAYGRLAVKAAKATNKNGKEYLFLQLEGGLQGKLYRADPEKEYDYVGSISAGNGEEYPVFGRRRKSEDGRSFIALSSGERRKSEAPSEAPAPAVNSFGMDDDIPF